MSLSSPSCIICAKTNTKRSTDGYIRITFDAFSSLNFQQKLTWEDESLRQDLILDDVPAFCAGYCEWAAKEASDQISIGWAWFGLPDGRTYVAPGGISSNVMFVTLNSCDLGMYKTNELLHAWLSGENWHTNEITSRF